MAGVLIGAFRGRDRPCPPKQPNGAPARSRRHYRSREGWPGRLLERAVRRLSHRRSASVDCPQGNRQG